MKIAASIFVIALGLASGAQAAVGDFGHSAMPVGVTLEPLGRAQGYGPQRWRQVSRAEIVYGNENGLTLYTSDADKAGVSNCVADCAATWHPVVPVAKAKPVEGWTIIKRADGTKQWAHDGKPLYTFKDDKEGGDVMGLGVDPKGDRAGGITGNDGRALQAVLPEGWHVHKAHTGGVSTLAIDSPIGFKALEVGDANGVVLNDVHDNDHERVLYFFNGDIAKDGRACGTVSATCAGFLPVQAPLLAMPVGKWTVADRKDGMRQWAFNGKPLYTYEADRITGDVHGVGMDKRFQLAVVDQYYMPTTVQYRDNFAQGRILTTPDGKSLYRRNPLSFNPASIQLAHDRPYRPRMGRMIRGVSCNAVCQKSWLPFFAPSDAQPSGYWGVSTRIDGKKIWTYKDFELFTFVGDKVEGDANGDATYDLLMQDDGNVDNDVGFPGLYKAGFYWSVATF